MGDRIRERVRHLVDEHRRRAIVAHPVTPRGVIILIDVGGQAGGAEIGPVRILRGCPVTLDVAWVVVEQHPCAVPFVPIGDDVYAGSHAAPL